jgi:flagellar hook-basal body complex protein FliE
MKLQRTLIPAPSVKKPTEQENTESASSSTEKSSFSDTLRVSIDEVNRLQEQADQAIEALSKGETKDIAQTMMAVEKANVSFQLMTQVRNRLIEAYQEIMRMQS